MIAKSYVHISSEASEIHSDVQGGSNTTNHVRAEKNMIGTRRMILASGLSGALAVAFTSIPGRALTWPQRPVKFIVPFGPGAGADIGARVLADRLQTKWEKPVIVENRPGGDSIVAITTFLNANDDHTFLFAPAGNFAVHPFIYSRLQYDPKELIPIVRVSSTILAVAVKADSPFKTIKDFTEAARAAPGNFNAAMVQGITEFTFWGYEHAEGLDIVQVPYRDINASAVDLGEGRIQIVMLSLAMMQAQVQAGRIRVLLVNNGTRAPILPDVPTAREAGCPSLEVEGLVGLFGIKAIPDDLKEKIAADVMAVAADGVIAERLKATGQVINIGGPKEFADAVEMQHAKIAATVKAINFKPKF
jgi:tripartite-type tricarboxylate transporter receptor subunit TctC